MSRAPKRLYSPMIGTLALLFLACATMLTILMLVEVIGPFRFLLLSPLEASRSFGLWAPDAEGAGTRKRIHAWRAVAPRDRERVESASLEELRLRGVRSIAVPDARRLGPDAIEALRSYLAAGGGVVLTGSIGVERPDGSWRGYELMKALLHASEIAQVPRRASDSIRAARRGPISAALPPRSRIALISEPGMPAVASPDAELRWDRVRANGGGRNLGASRRIEIGRGRIAWLAVGPESAREGAREPWHAMLRLLRNAIAWSARLPSIEILPWPNGAAFAAKLVDAADGDPAAAAHPGRKDELLAEIESAQESAALLLLAVGDSVDASRPRTPSSLRQFARSELRRRGAWIAADGEIQRWTRIHATVHASLRQRGPRRIQLDVTNDAAEIAENIAVRLHLNLPVEAASAANTRVLQARAEVRLEPRAEWIDVLLPALPARSSHAYHIDFELVADRNGEPRPPAYLAIDGRERPLHAHL